MKKIAFIGGSGLEDFRSGERVSYDGVYHHQRNQLEIYFVARHGENHEFSPLELPDRQEGYMNRLKEEGVETIIGFTATGTLDENVALADEGSFVVIDQFIRGLGYRAISSARRLTPHADVTQPFNNSLRQLIIEEGTGLNLVMHPSGIYFQNAGNNFETAAEVAYLGMVLRLADHYRTSTEVSFPGIEHLTLKGAQLGMTVVPEAILARELDIPYAAIACPVNLGAGMGDHQIDHEQDTLRVIEGSKKHIRELTEALIIRLAATEAQDLKQS